MINRNIFICYRNKNLDYARKVTEHIKERSKNEVLDLNVHFSNDDAKTVGNYLYDIDKLCDAPNKCDHVVLIVDDEFTNGFLVNGKINDNCVTAKEIIAICNRLKNKDNSIILYQININGQAINFKDMESFLKKAGLSDCTKAFTGLYQKPVNTDDELVRLVDFVVEDILKTATNPMDVERYFRLFKENIAYKTLPSEKLQRCIYSSQKGKNLNNPEEALEIINEFYQLYIEKKVYRYNDNDTSERIHNFYNDALTHHSVLIGGAGCGKSTLLFDTYIRYAMKLVGVDITEGCENLDDKVIPIFVDLNTVTDANLNSVNGLIGRIEAAARINSNERFDLTELFNNLSLQGYKVLLILDSLDECHVQEIMTQLEFFKQYNTFLDQSGIDYGVLLGLRSGLFDKLSFDNNRSIKRYMVKDFDVSDVTTYLDKLIESGKIVEEQIKSIETAIDLLTFQDKVNPFLVAMIVQPYSEDKNYNQNVEDIKIADLISKSAKSQLKGVNANRSNSSSVNEATLEIIGVMGQLGSIGNRKDNYNKYCLDVSFSEESFSNDLTNIAEKTYLINPQGTFYQKIFSDFFSAKYVYSYLNKTRNKTKANNFYEILNNIFLLNNANEFYGYFALLVDKNDYYELNNDSKDEVIDEFLNLMFDKCDHLQSYHNVCSMLECLKRYSGKMNKKDDFALELSATYHAKELITHIYERFFMYLAKSKLIDYGAFYGSLVHINLFDLAIQAIANLVSQKRINNDNAFKMLSILRDGYINLHYNLKTTDYKCPYPNTLSEEQKKELYDLAIASRQLHKLSNREALNAIFYSLDVVPIDRFKNKLFKHNYFPVTFNLNVFVNKENEKEYKQELYEDKLFSFNSNYNYSIALINSSKLKELSNQNKQYGLNDDVLSLYIISDGVNEICNVLANKSQIRSLEIGSGITIINEYTFRESKRLINVIFPKSIKRLERFSFEHCDVLEQFVLNDGLEFLGESVVEDCATIEKIVIPTSVKEIGNYPFEQCSSLKVIDFGFNNIKLSDGIFKGCRSIEDIKVFNLSRELKCLPRVSFSSLESIRKIDLTPYEKLETIESYCFTENLTLEEVYLPKSLKKIGNACFWGCVNLRVVSFSSKPVCSSQMFAGLDVEHKIELRFPGNVIIIDGSTNIASTLNSIGVEVVEDMFVDEIALEKNDHNDGYVIGYSFNENNKAFRIFDSRKYSKMGIKITGSIIGGLGNHDLLNDATFDENFEETAEWMFEDCNSLNTVNLGKTKIKALESHMFKNCESLTEIVLPATIEVIKPYAFDGCINLRKVFFVKNCIDRCLRKEKITIDECVGKNELSCDIHKEHILSIPCNITSIGEYAFKDCANIKEVHIFNKDIKIDDFAFTNNQIKKQFD